MCSGAKDWAEGARGAFFSWQDLKTRAERGTAAPSALSEKQWSPDSQAALTLWVALRVTVAPHTYKSHPQGVQAIRAWCGSSQGRVHRVGAEDCQLKHLAQLLVITLTEEAWFQLSQKTHLLCAPKKMRWPRWSSHRNMELFRSQAAGSARA